METTTTKTKTDKAANARDFKWGYQVFATNEEAWSFMRDCEAKDWVPGWPTRVFCQGRPGAWFRVTFVVR